MKKKFLAIVAVILCMAGAGSAAFAQEKPAKDSTKSKDSVTIEKLMFKLDQLTQLVKKAALKDMQTVGVVRIKNKPPILYYDKEETGENLLISRVTLNTRDGYIVDVNVYAGDKKFTNTRAPISLTGKRFQKKDFLFADPEERYSVILQDILAYDAFNSFFGEDKLIVLVPDSLPADTLKKNVGINTVLDVRLYTDALAAIGKESNGVFQTDVRFKQFIHHYHLTNSGKAFFQYFKLALNVAKFDSKSSFVDSSDQVSRTGVVQKSKLTGELSFNVIKTWAEKKTINDFYLDFGGGFGKTDLAGKKDTVPIFAQYLFFETGYNFKTSSNIGFDVYARPFVQYSPQTDFNGQDSGIWFLRLGGEVFWNPFNESSAGRLFGRMNYTMGMKRSEKKNSFAQVQFGYSLLLSNLLGAK